MAEQMHVLISVSLHSVNVIQTTYRIFKANRMVRIIFCCLSKLRLHNIVAGNNARLASTKVLYTIN